MKTSLQLMKILSLSSPAGRLLLRAAFVLLSTAAAALVLVPPVAQAAPFTFDNTGSLATARYRHTATLLPNGKVFVAGGLDSSNDYLASAELYDPATGTWTATGSLVTAREVHTATVLPNGKELEAGGLGSGRIIKKKEEHDPASGTARTTSALHPARAAST